jgi:hypothetical protein
MVRQGLLWYDHPTRWRHVSASAATAFAEALSRPAQVNERLAAALHRPRKFTWLDWAVDGRGLKTWSPGAAHVAPGDVEQ